MKKDSGRPLHNIKKHSLEREFQGLGKKNWVNGEFENLPMARFA